MAVMIRRRLRGIPGGAGRRPSGTDFTSAADSLREVAERLQPLNERLEEVRGEIMDRLAAAGMHDGIRELNVEVFDEGDEVVAIVELPGFAESDISVTVDEREVTVDGVKSGRHFSGSASLPDEVMAGWAVTTRNGLVEIRFRKRKEDGS